MSYPSRLHSGNSRTALLTVALVLGPLSAQAGERVQVRPRIEASIEYADNPTHSRSHPENDGITRVRPSLELYSESERGHMSLSFGADTRTHLELHELNAVDPYARFRIERDLSRRLELFGNGRWARRTDRDPVDDPDSGDDDALLLDGRPDVERRSALLGMRYHLSPASDISLAFDDGDADYEPNDADDGAVNPRGDELDPRRDHRTSGIALEYRRAASPRDLLFATFSQRWNAFDDITQEHPGTVVPGETVTLLEQEESQSSVALGWRREWTPTWSTVLRGGARLLEAEGNEHQNVTFFRPDGSTTDLEIDDRSTALVGVASVTRSTQRSTLTLSLEAETRPSSGRTGSVDVQTLRAGYRRQLTERLSLDLRGEVGRQESATDFDVFQVLTAAFGQPDYTAAARAACFDSGGLYGDWDSGVPRLVFDRDEGRLRFTSVLPVCSAALESLIDTDVQRFDLTLDWRMRRTLTTFLRYTFVDRDADGAVGSSYRDHRVRIGFRYYFGVDLPSGF